MQQTTRTWDELRSSARMAERRLEDKIAAYTEISRALTRSSVAVYDEGGRNKSETTTKTRHRTTVLRLFVPLSCLENPRDETVDDNELAVDIENALALVGAYGSVAWR